MKIHTLDGLKYDINAVNELRENLITLRNNAFKNFDSHVIILLFHVIAVLGFYIEELSGVIDSKNIPLNEQITTDRFGPRLFS